jgi:hypothetical protein
LDWTNLLGLLLIVLIIVSGPLFDLMAHSEFTINSRKVVVLVFFVASIGFGFAMLFGRTRLSP